jgi:hypothetical protein
VQNQESLYFADGRGIGFRTPIMLVGYGVAIDGTPVPSGGDGKFLSGYRRKYNKHKVGALDPLWDEVRSMWTCHGMFEGKTVSSIPAKGSGLVDLYDDVTKIGKKVMVYNAFNASVNSNTEVYVAYFPHSNRLRIIAADC